MAEMTDIGLIRIKLVANQPNFGIKIIFGSRGLLGSRELVGTPNSSPRGWRVVVSGGWRRL